MSLSAAGIRRLAVTLQAAAALGIAAGLVRLGGWPWPGAVAAGVAAILGSLASGIAFAFALSGRGLWVGRGNHPPAPPVELAATRRPLRLPEALRCFAAECLAVLRMFDWLQPFRAHTPFAAPLDTLPGRDAPPVLLVHGYACGQAIWLDMQPALAAAGYRCEGIELKPVFGDIDDYARALLAAMRRITAEAGRPPLLVCHSMGGLAARAALQLAGDEDICAGVVTLGSPHHGSALARFGGGPNARQMRCGSPWLRALAAAETPRRRARMISIFSWHDSIAGPPCTGWLDGAGHIPLAGVGHVTLLRHPAAVRAVLDALAELSGRGH
ncbi:triacylglycerol lipase [Cupriavidus sp. UYPR2.512]|uniref:esterase/lipase family protein n=1 Tax=Cupriavidus sp. UYPR2.512 TaxID=1080187 RepID=UPI00036EBAB0|nr:alpha/beta fold hydrolase [Cupriavidus sp. UYPR2.512]UIF87061.1 alpha/beta fold hydrolase [Cupriavidus necator]